MIPSREVIDSRGANLDLLGEGAFAKVYDQGDGTCVKFAKTLDGTADFIKWCFERAKNPQACMDQLPMVEAYGEYTYSREDPVSEEIVMEVGWWCVMPIYVRHFERCLEDDCRHVSTYDVTNDIAQYVNAATGIQMNDRHSGNVMWDREREQWIMTDPSSSNSKRSKTGAARLMVEGGLSMDRMAEIDRQVVQQMKPDRALPIYKFLQPDQPRVIKTKRIAAWKIPQLRQQQHMRM